MGSLFDDWIADKRPEAEKMEEINEFRTPRHPFITGSRVYGDPKPDSDLDMVIIADKDVESRLLEHSGGEFPVRYGKLNLILCRNGKEYDSWKEAMTKCLNRKNKLGRPLTKEEACLIHDLVHEKNGTVIGDASGKPEGEILPRKTYNG